MGIKVWCYWEHIGEPIGNFVKFTWEPYEKRLGSFIWDRKEPPKNISCWAGQSHQKLNVVVVHICSETQPAFAAKFLVGHHYLETKVHKQKWK
jgi:hypothetical protein